MDIREIALSLTEVPVQPMSGRSAFDLGLLLRTGLVDPVQVTEAALAAAGDAESVFTVLTPERAMTEARAARRRIAGGRSRGPLDGVPIAVKDLFDVAGLTTLAGSKVLADQPAAAHDAPVVAALTAAGAICIGKTNMTEFAFSGIGLNPHYGTPVNPRSGAIGRVPGGSSSGSAAAVAGGIVPVALGSDTGGSVRIPAAFCGIVGYKSSNGRYPMAGTFPLSRSLDTIGVLCHSVEDAVITDAAMLRLVVPAVRRGRVEGARLIVPSNVVFDDVEPAVMANFEAALGRLMMAGVEVERRPVPVFDVILALIAENGPLVSAEAFHLHRDRLHGAPASHMDRVVVERMKLGARTNVGQYQETLIARARMIAETAAWMDGGALVAFPTVAHIAPPIAALQNDDALFLKMNGRTLRNTMLGNFLDWCGVSIPNGTGDDRMPTGFLINGAPGADDAMLSFALAAETIIRGEG